MNQKKLWAIFFKIIVIGFVFYITYILTIQQPVIRSKRKQIQELNNKIKVAQEENNKLREQLIMVGSDSYVEKQARDKLGLIKPGEKIFIDIDE